jgi:hypothetical protein
MSGDNRNNFLLMLIRELSGRSKTLLDRRRGPHLAEGVCRKSPAAATSPCRWMGGASNVEILNAVVVWRLISRSSMFHRILLRSAYHC